MATVKQILLGFLLLDLELFYLLFVWGYPYIFAPQTDDNRAAELLAKYNEPHYIVLEYGEQIPVYTLKEHYDLTALD